MLPVSLPMVYHALGPSKTMNFNSKMGCDWLSSKRQRMMMTVDDRGEGRGVEPIK